MPRVNNNKDTLVTTKFPWNTLGAETLRAVIRDLGVNSKTIRAPQKGVYVQFLQTVSDKGLDAACEIAQSSIAEAESLSSTRTRSTSVKTKSTSPKRKADQMEAELAEYNTRFKGKRQRVWGPGGVQRKAKTTEASKSGPVSSTRQSISAPATRSAPPAKKRGRPRKSQPKPQASLSGDGKREVFDGVVLPPPSRGKQKEIELTIQGADAPLGQLVVGEDGLLEIDGHFEPDTDFIEVPQTVLGLPSPPGGWNEPYSDSNKENLSVASHLGVADALSADFTIQIHAPSHQGHDSDAGNEPATLA